MIEKYPDMSSFPRTGSFKISGDLFFFTGIDEGEAIHFPFFFVEICRDQPGAVISQMDYCTAGC